jgi:hypothetical protein
VIAKGAYFFVDEALVLLVTVRADNGGMLMTARESDGHRLGS